jgi:hypothetical protein
LDLTEDWYDTFEIPLILGFWIADVEKIDENTIPEVNSFANINLGEKAEENNCDCEEEHCDCEDEHHHEIDEFDEFSEDENYQRVGFKHWNWNKNFVDFLEKTLDLLYYHNYTTHIVDVNLSEKENN